MPPDPPHAAPVPLPAGLGTVVAVRWVGNAITRIPYVFVTAFSAGLGVPLTTMTTILGVRELGGVASVGIGRWSDHGHERRAQVTCALTGGALAVLAGLTNDPLPFALCLIGCGVAVFGLLAAQTSWVSHRVPFERRARAVGITELTWGAAFFLAAPLAAWLIDIGGWQLPLRVFGAALIVGGVLTFAVLPADHHGVETAEPPARWSDVAAAARRHAGVVAYNVLQPFAQMLVFAVAGDWFVQHLGMSLTGLGANTLLIGAGEIIGTAATFLFADRVGPARAGIAGMVIAVPCAAALGLVGANAALGVALLVGVALGMELSFVSAFPLLTEVAPASRAAMIGTGIALMTVSRAVAAVAAGWIYEAGGITASGLSAAATATLAALSLVPAARTALLCENRRKPRGFA